MRTIQLPYFASMIKEGRTLFLQEESENDKIEITEGGGLET